MEFHFTIERYYNSFNSFTPNERDYKSRYGFFRVQKASLAYKYNGTNMDNRSNDFIKKYNGAISKNY
jgi:hypothetical protein